MINIPDELRKFPQWVTYRLAEKTKTDPLRLWKQAKIPMNPRTGGNAAVDAPYTWSTYEVALAALHGGTGDGLGYVFWKGDSKDKLHIPADPFVGIDLDDCLNQETGELDSWAQEIVDIVNSYTEKSPSGHGVKILLKGILPGKGRPSPLNKNFEIYNHGRFFTITGQHLPGTPTTIEERSAALAEIYAQHFLTDKGKVKTHAKFDGQKHASDLTQAQEALTKIPADDYKIWLDCGMALHSCDQGEASFAVWEAWSGTCPEKFDADVCRRKWATFSAERDEKITLGTLFSLAKQHGWTNGNGGTDWSDVDNEVENARVIALEREPDEGEEQHPRRSEFTPVIICAKDVIPEEVTYLWYPYLPEGKLCLLGGDSGAGKTFLTMSLTTALSQGQWPYLFAGKESVSRPQHTVIFSAEDGYEDTLVPRLISLGTDLSHVHFSVGKKDWGGNLHRVVMNDEDIIARTIHAANAKLAIFDPFQGFLPPRTKMNDMETVRPVLSALIRTAKVTKCCILLVGHLSKAKQESASYKFIGSVDWYAGARSAMLVMKDPENTPEGRIFYQTKHSLGAEHPGVRFAISKKTDPPFLWGQSTDQTAEEVMAGGAIVGTRAEDAEEFLKAELAEGERTVDELKEAARQLGLAWRTVWRAKSKLNIRSRKDSFDGGWRWEFPPKDAK